jgi:murein L,D-transpeptidase YafK
MIAVLLIGVLAANDPAPQAKEMKADQVVVIKSQRTLSLLSQSKVIRSYKVALGSNPVGPKEQQGDHKTPEGHYILDRRNSKSRFYKSIHVSYPNEPDEQRAKERGGAPGGDIMIHACQTVSDGWVLLIAPWTGPMAALP